MRNDLLLLVIPWLWLTLYHAQALTCLQQSDPLDPTTKIQVDCSPLSFKLETAKKGSLSRVEVAAESVTNNSTAANSTTTTNGSTVALSFDGLTSPVKIILAEPAARAPVTGQNATNMFEFLVACPASLSTTTCASASKTMYDAGQLISNVLILTSPIIVNATLMSFCSAMSICSEGTDILSLAAAAPARTIPLVDDDGVTRLYPQAVVKQFGSLLESVPQFSTVDVNLNINSDASFYFSSQANSISSSQSDFLYVVLHEIMHGLGFTSSYEDYFHKNASTTITPNVLLTYGIGGATNISFSGFVEYAFDRYFAFSSGGFMTDAIKAMNDLMLQATMNLTFTSTTDLGTFFVKDDPVNAISTGLTRNFTTAHTTLFTSPNQNSSTLLVLETSISPFSSGSSISHVAKDLYLGTGDFLMRYISTKGVTLQQAISQAANNGAKDTDLYGAIGPGLRGVLGGLGYRVRGGIPGASNVTTATTTTTKSAGERLQTGQFPLLSLVICLLVFIG